MACGRCRFRVSHMATDSTTNSNREPDSSAPKAAAGAALERPVVDRGLRDHGGGGARQIGRSETDLLAERQQQEIEDAKTSALTKRAELPGRWPLACPKTLWTML